MLFTVGCTSFVKVVNEFKYCEIWRTYLEVCALFTISKNFEFLLFSGAASRFNPETFEVKSLNLLLPRLCRPGSAGLSKVSHSIFSASLFVSSNWNSEPEIILMKLLPLKIEINELQMSHQSVRKYYFFSNAKKELPCRNIGFFSYSKIFLSHTHIELLSQTEWWISNIYIIYQSSDLKMKSRIT